MSIDGISAVNQGSGKRVEAYYDYMLAGRQANRTEPDRQANGGLTESQKKEVDDLKKRDAEVRQHERAHLAAAGSYARSGAKYEYDTGPDGRRYAVGGEVQIDTSEVADDPEATIKKMQIVQKAAMAPKDPSAQDHRVAAQARQVEMKARQDLASQKQAETQTGHTGQSAAISALPPKPTRIDFSV